MDYGLKHVCGRIVPKRCQTVNVSTIVICLEESAFHPKDPWSVFKTFYVFGKEDKGSGLREAAFDFHSAIRLTTHKKRSLEIYC